MSYLETAIVLASVVEARCTSAALLAAYRVVLGHMARSAVPDGLSIAAIDTFVRRWRDAPSMDLAGDLANIARCKNVLPRSAFDDLHLQP